MLEGAYVFDDFVSENEEFEITKFFDARPWGGKGLSPNPELRRCTQHYGRIFSYRNRSFDDTFGSLNSHIPAILDFIRERVEKKIEKKYCCQNPSFQVPFDIVIVNEYLKGEGIMAHIDSPVLFGPVIMSLSLLSDCVMVFKHKVSGEEEKILLKARSLLILTGSSRYDWSHSISKDPIDEFVSEDNIHIAIPRERRISLTFRSIINDNVK